MNNISSTLLNGNTTIALKIKTRPNTKAMEALYPFDMFNIKVDNISDPNVVKSIIDKSHDEYNKTINDKLCLNGITSEICCIGVKVWNDSTGDEYFKIFDNHVEVELLKEFWGFINDLTFKNYVNVYTWYGNTFDIPIIYQRSAINSVLINKYFPSQSTLGTFNADKCACRLIDVGKIWSCNKFTTFDKLNHVAYAFGLVTPAIQEDFNLKLNYNNTNWCNDYNNEITKDLMCRFLLMELNFIQQISIKLKA